MGWPRVAKVDAMLIELLASSVAAGLARLEQEKATLAARVQFEQFSHASWPTSSPPGPTFFRARTER